MVSSEKVILKEDSLLQQGRGGGEMYLEGSGQMGGDEA